MYRRLADNSDNSLFFEKNPQRVTIIHNGFPVKRQAVAGNLPEKAVGNKDTTVFPGDTATLKSGI